MNVSYDIILICGYFTGGCKPIVVMARIVRVPHVVKLMVEDILFLMCLQQIIILYLYLKRRRRFARREIDQ